MMWNKRIHFQPTSDMCLFDEYKLEFMLVKAVDLSPPPPRRSIVDSEFHVKQIQRG